MQRREPHASTRFRQSLKRQARGFTIVELLIVVVVIAILAAITVVAYNGISRSANETRVQSEIAALAKGMAIYSIDSAVFPTDNTGLKNVLEATNLYSTLRSPEWRYLYCSSGTAFALLPDNAFTEPHNYPSMPGDLWRAYISNGSWIEITFDPDADPVHSGVGVDLCTTALPGHTFAQWSSAI